MSSSDAIHPRTAYTPPEPPASKSASPTSEATDAQAFKQAQACETTCKGTGFRNRVRNFVDECKKTLDTGKSWLDRIIPNNRLQIALDDFGAKIHELLEPARTFNAWLDSNGKGQWYERLCTCLLKLPFRLCASILQMTYGTIKSIAYAFVHPLKSLVDLAKVFVEFIYSLTESVTYTKMGAATIGASLAHAAISSGFGVHSYIGLGIGGGLLIIGVLWGVTEAAITPSTHHRLVAVGLAFYEHIAAIPTSLLLGFLLALAVGAIAIGMPGSPIQHPPIANPDIPFDKADAVGKEGI